MSEYLTREKLLAAIDAVEKWRHHPMVVSRKEKEAILDILNWCDDCQAGRPCLCEQKEWEMEQAINDAEGEAREEWPENWGEQ